MARTLNPALKATQIINERIFQDIGCERRYWFGLITYVNTLRKEAKKLVKDEKDFIAVNNKINELFNSDLDKKGKDKIIKEIKDFYNEAMGKRGKRGKRGIGETNQNYGLDENTGCVKTDDNITQTTQNLFEKISKSTEVQIKELEEGWIYLNIVPENNRTYELCMEAIKNHGNALQFVPEHHKTYELCWEAVKNKESALQWVPEQLKNGIKSIGKL